MFKKLALTSLLTPLLLGSLMAEEDGILLEEMPSFKVEQVKKDRTRNKLDYPAKVIVAFVDSCATNMMQYMPVHPSQSRPIALTMCSCFIDQFRSDFDIKQFTKGGSKLAKAMSEEYGEVCKQLELTKAQSL
jgi:hypothetical protein